jgi:hypothetical protein
MYISKKLFNWLYWRLYSDVLAGVKDAEIINRFISKNYSKDIIEDFDEEKYLEKIKKEIKNGQ